MSDDPKPMPGPGCPNRGTLDFSGEIAMPVLLTECTIENSWF